MKFVTVRSKLFDPGSVTYLGFMADSFTYVVHRIMEEYVLPKRMKCPLCMAAELQDLTLLDINEITNEELEKEITTVEVRVYDTLQRQVFEL